MTKLLILSDSHGGSDAIARILKAERENIDALIFLGDGLRDLELALTKYPCWVWFSRLPVPTLLRLPAT